MEEEWRDILNYEDLYQVSSLGNVKSLYRRVPNGKGGMYNRSGKVLKQALNPKGYLTVSLSKNGKWSTKRVHQLVAIAFHGHKPNGMSVIVDHKDGDKLNNNKDNLQVTTCRVNNTKDLDKTKTSSKYVGVCWSKDRQKWISYITINKKRKVLGRFHSEEEASKARETALKEQEKNFPWEK